MVETVAVCSGGFDPCHSGHLSYFRSAKSMADILVVGVNSDEWLSRKKRQPFLGFDERAVLLKEIRSVDAVLGFDDTDDSACDLLLKVREMYPTAHIMFCNGGDRDATNIPEMGIQDSDLSFHFSVGGRHKINSSTRLLSNWQNIAIEENWGEYVILNEHPDGRVKLVTVNPGCSTPLVRHRNRDETLVFMTPGAHVLLDDGEGELEKLLPQALDAIKVSALAAHQIFNTTDQPVKFIEYQKGACREDDII